MSWEDVDSRGQQPKEFACLADLRRNERREAVRGATALGNSSAEWAEYYGDGPGDDERQDSEQEFCVVNSEAYR